MPREFHLDDVKAEFRDAFASAGLVPPVEIIADGEWRRCDVAGKRPGNGDGTYWLVVDGYPSGLLNNYVEGRRITWHPNRTARKFTKAVREDAKRRIAEAHAQREAVKQTAAEKVAAIAEIILATYPECTAKNPYLASKQVGAYGLKAHKLATNICYVPMRDIDGKLWAWQTIFDDGRKDFEYGTHKVGCFHTIGTLVDGDPIQISEGYATAASCYESNGVISIVAFDAGNLIPVAKAIHERYPNSPITILADDDVATQRDRGFNPGIEKASEAALAVGGKIAIPDFGPDRRDDQTDFNDLAAARGSDAVRQQIAEAREPERPQPTYPMPGDAVDVDAGRAQLERIVDEFTKAALAPPRSGIDLNLPTVACLNVTPGLGKTTAVLERLVPAALKAGKVVHIYVPRHALGRQHRDFLAATGIDSRVYQSRGSDDPEKPGQTMCIETDRTEAINDALGDVSELACKSKKGVCEFYDGDNGCGYQRQLRDPLPRVWFIPRDNLFRPLPSRIPKPDIVVIDERFHDASIEDDVVLEINDIIDDRTWPKKDHKTEDEADLRAIAQKVYMVLHEQLSQQARCRVRREWFDGVITAKDAKDAHRLEWNRKLLIDDVFPGMDSDLAVQRAKRRQFHNQTVKRLCAFWEKLALTLEKDWELSLYLSIDRDCAIPFSERSAPAVVIASRMDMHDNITRCPTLHLDGTMVPLIVEQFYPIATFHEIAVKMPPSTTFVQETDRTISKSSNSELIIEQCRQLVETEAKSTNGLVGVITLTHIERELRKSNPPLPENVKIWHYGNMTGLNDFSDASIISLIGRQEPRPIDVEKQARLLFRREVLEVPGYYPKKTRRIALRGGGTVTVEGTYHPDPGVEALRWTGCEGEALQALHRGRPINRTAANPLKVIVATNLCLPIEIDHTMPWDAMRPLLFEAVLARGDAFPMSYADLAAAYPSMFPSRDAAIKAFTRARETMDDSLEVSIKRIVHSFGLALVLTKTAGSYRKTSIVFEAQYRRAGARGPATILLFNRDWADPAAWLHKRLGDASLITPTGENE